MDQKNSNSNINMVNEANKVIDNLLKHKFLCKKCHFKEVSLKDGVCCERWLYNTKDGKLKVTNQYSNIPIEMAKSYIIGIMNSLGIYFRSDEFIINVSKT